MSEVCRFESSASLALANKTDHESGGGTGGRTVGGASTAGSPKGTITLVLADVPGNSYLSFIAMALV